MGKVTPEETHALLEKLAEYVMTQVATRAEMNERFEQVDKRFEQIDKRFEQIDKRFEQIDVRFEQVDARFEQKDGKLTAIQQHLDLMRAEQAVFVKTFELHNKRLSLLEDEDLGYRVRDKKEKK